MTIAPEQMAEILRDEGDAKHPLVSNVCAGLADAIDAHIAGMGEPVATICDGWDLRFVGSAPIAEVVRKHGLKIGDTLYIAPPIDLAAVREVIAELRDYGDYADRIKLGEATDKLEAAIKGGV